MEISGIIAYLVSLAIMAGIWRSITINSDRFEDEMRGDFSLATELADALVLRGTPFREAHEAVAELVRDLEAAGRGPFRCRLVRRSAQGT